LFASGKTRAVHFDVVHHVGDVFHTMKKPQRRMLSDLTRPKGSKKLGHPRRLVEDEPASGRTSGSNVAMAMLFTTRVV